MYPHDDEFFGQRRGDRLGQGGLPCPGLGYEEHRRGGPAAQGLGCQVKFVGPADEGPGPYRVDVGEAARAFAAPVK